VSELSPAQLDVTVASFALRESEGFVVVGGDAHPASFPRRRPDLVRTRRVHAQPHQAQQAPTMTPTNTHQHPPTPTNTVNPTTPATRSLSALMNHLAKAKRQHTPVKPTTYAIRPGQGSLHRVLPGEVTNAPSRMPSLVRRRIGSVHQHRMTPSVLAISGPKHVWSCCI
jgi:hypothetical protein